jgi:type IV pilus assembly protein PilY1
MKILAHVMKLRHFFVSALFATAILSSVVANAATSLADQPLFAAGKNLPGNVALAISAEFPTALTYAYPDKDTSGTIIPYDINAKYEGYFDPDKCYSYYTTDPVTTNGMYFKPVANATVHACSGQWSGNFLNWATMQSLDPFRQTLSGGNRVVDTASITVLEKAWSSGQGSYQNRVKTITTQTLISQSTPINSALWTTFNIRIDMLGNKMWYSNASVTAANTTATVNATAVQADTADVSAPTPNLIYQKLVRVKVCDTSSTLESNCTQYPGGNYKPTGLIQSNSTKLRFSAFGYLADPAYMNDNGFTGTYTTTTQTRNQNRQGGVLRAKMAFVGPSALGTYGIVNDNSAASEWDKNTGIFVPNPDASSANLTATSNGLPTSAVPNSGVVNYLNKFGSTSGKYKVYDRTAELYYAATRYFKNLGNVSAYTDMTGYTTAEKTQLIDGFPVITSWVDPIQYSCQKNFILGIGDNNTYPSTSPRGTTANLPGSTSTNGTVPTEVTNDTTVNVSAATNRIAGLQGITPPIGLMGGLAFDSHTRDIRTDAAMPNKQTISTYWLDVLELPHGYVANNQYILATKFGGFDVPANYQPCSTSATCPTPPTIPTTTTGDATWDKNSDGLPDNYFKANNPASMRDSLNKAFDAIANEALNGSSISFATSSATVQNGSMKYATAFDSDGWTGDVIATQISVSNTGLISYTKKWNAMNVLENQAKNTGWDTGRFIATATCSSGSAGMQSCSGKPFRLASISSTQANALTTTTANQQSLLNFLRGDRSNAGSAGSKLYRERTAILGDIVNSRVVPVGPPSKPYVDTFNPGYSAFKTANANRPVVTYVGSNDGMLHAFDGSFTGGNELFAYVPNALFNGPNNAPATEGLAQLASTSYLHHYYVDATPAVNDVDFGGGDWHSLLVSGLGKGGKSYFAIDVTNPTLLSNETNLAANVKWEFTHQDMGYTYDTPLVIKTAQYGWVVVLTSGYNNTDGKGYFFLVKPSDGTLLARIPLSDPAQGAGTDAGLAHVNAFVADGRSGLADALYAGDLFGNVWRVDLTGTTYTPMKIAKLTAPDGTVQPVTTSPVIQVDTNTGKRYVFVGTGKLLDSADMNSTQTQTFYAINDGTLSSFYTASTLPTGVTFPIQRTDLNNDTSTILTGIGSNPAKSMGYYIDLGTSNGKPYFINVEMASGSGTIAFIANSVDNSDACSPTGTNLGYTLYLGTGKSALFQTDASGNAVLDSFGSKIPVANVAGQGLGVNVAYVKIVYTDINGNVHESNNVVFSNDTGGGTPTPFGTATSKGFTQLNWRELPTAD